MFGATEIDERVTAELRRLHAVNQELLEALKLALEYWRHRQQRYKNPQSYVGAGCQRRNRNRRKRWMTLM